MVDKLSKYSKYVLIGLLVLDILFLIFGLVDGARMHERWLNRPVEEYGNPEWMYYHGYFMVFAYSMIELTLDAILFAFIFTIVVKPESLKSIGIILGIVAVLAAISWIMSKATLSLEYLESMGVTTGTERFVDFAMIFTYIVMGGTIASVIYSAVAKLINK